MAPSGIVQRRQLHPPNLAVGRARALLLFIGLAALAACSSHPVTPLALEDIPPLQWQGRSLTTEFALTQAPSPDLLAIDPQMVDFVKRYTGDAVNGRQRLMSLHQAISGAGALDLQYDPFADGSAIETFNRGNANCLSYTHLFVALAREAGLDASYQWQEVRPRWNRNGERVVVGMHVSTLVKLRRGEQFVVDIDPLPTREITDSHKISDREALALHHNNIAMDALANENLEVAWAQGLRALELSPDNGSLWANLGAIYRFAGQHSQAEHSYLYALQLDPRAYSAMTNLVILYGLDGREEERQYWLGRVEHYREANPYYHASLGEQAGEVGQWNVALQHYDKALELNPDDSHILFARGLVHQQLGQFGAASDDIKRAIERATLNSDIRSYQQALEEVHKERLAGV